VAGPTGVFKTELAAIIQAFFGASFDARHLPGSWSSTGNSLEELAFLAKDAIIVIDDFAPSGSSYDVQRYHKEADRVFRAQGNRSGRGRLRSDGSHKNVRPPRGLIISTGEDIPAGQSLRARIIVLELSRGDIDSDTLSQCQNAARSGILVETTAGFLQWAALRYDDLQLWIKERVPDLRSRIFVEGRHRRSATILAELFAGFELFLDFASTSGAIDRASVENLREQSWNALLKAGATQEHHQKSSEPTAAFLRLLRSAVASGEAHIADHEGNIPKNCEALGWRRHRTADYDEWNSMGMCVGWIREDDLYLNAEASYKAAQRMAQDTDRIIVGLRTLIRRLAEGGHLVSRDVKRGKNTVRVQLQGARRSVLHISADVLLDGAQEAHEGQ